MQCLYCNKPLTNPKAKYCNGSHRMAYVRQQLAQPAQITRTEKLAQSEQPAQNNPHILPEQQPTTPESDKSVSKLTAEELYMGINSYPHDTWAESVEYKELIRRLETLSIKQLRDQGFFVPAWKLNGAKKKPVLAT